MHLSQSSIPSQSWKFGCHVNRNCYCSNTNNIHHISSRTTQINRFAAHYVDKCLHKNTAITQRFVNHHRIVMSLFVMSNQKTISVFLCQYSVVGGNTLIWFQISALVYHKTLQTYLTRISIF